MLFFNAPICCSLQPLPLPSQHVPADFDQPRSWRMLLSVIAGPAGCLGFKAIASATKPVLSA
jgi:hypothetical protein